MRAQMKDLKALEARKGLCPDDAARRDVALTDVTLLLIAGGRSSRMGRDKRFLQLGGTGLLERTLQKARAEHFQEIILCVEDDTPELRALAEQYGASLCRDDVPRQGPMAGLAAGLSRMTTPWALALSSDMPFFDFAAVRPLREACQPGKQAVLPVAGGRRQPLAAFYHQSFAEACRAALRRGERRLCHLIEQTPHLDVAVAHEEAAFFNVNTPADLRLARGRIANETRRVPIVSIVAPASGTGKTTFIERLLPRLLAHGLRVGVVKSDAHGFQLDQEGKDSWRFTQAGATGVAVVSPAGWCSCKRRRHVLLWSSGRQDGGHRFAAVGEPHARHLSGAFPLARPGGAHDGRRRRLLSSPKVLRPAVCRACGAGLIWMIVRRQQGSASF